MKKQFLTLALLATVAVGGAQAEVYLLGETDPIPCEQGEAGCSIEYGEVGYTVPFSNDPNAPKQDSSTQVDLNEYQLIQ